MLKRPLAGVVLLLAGGIAAGWVWPAPWTWPALVAALAGGGVLACRRLGHWFFPLHVLAAGMALVAVRTAPLGPHDLRLVAAPEARIVTLTGRLAAPPEERLHGREGDYSTNTLAVLEVRELADAAGARPARGRAMASVRGRLPEAFRAGAEVAVEGVLRPPPGPRAPGLFDYAAWLRVRGIHFELRTQGAQDWRLAGAADARPDWRGRFQAWARARLAAGLGEPDRPLRLLHAMVLGWRTALTDEVEEPFMRSGTMHLFAISGLHIALIAAVVAHTLGLLFVPRPAAGVVTLAVAWAYALATGAQPSAVRAAIMISVVVGGWMLHRPVDLLNSLAAAALLVLLAEPRQLFAAGFQLSFSVVGALGLLLPRLERLRDRLWPVDPFLPSDVLPPWERWARPAWRLVTGNFAVSLAAWLGSLPLTAQYFHLVPFVGLLANLVVVPLAAAALTSALAGLLFAWWPAVGELFNHGAWFWMSLAEGLSRRLAEVPGGAWHAAPPPAAWIAAWYLLLGVAGLGRRRWPGWRWGAAGAGILVLAGLGMAEIVRARGFAQLTVLPLRGGHVVLVEPARGGPRLLVDTGDEASALAVTRPLLMARGVNRLPRLALTHGDIRHVGGAAAVLARFRVDEVVAPAPEFRSPAWRAALAAAAARAVPVRRVTAGESAGAWRVRHPPAAARAARADDASLVLTGEVDGLRVALVADLSRAGEEAWLNAGAVPGVDVLVTGVAEGRALSPALLRALQPRLIVVADAAQPATARLPAEARAAWAAAGAPAVFLSDAGAVRLRWRRDGRPLVEEAQGRAWPAAAGPVAPLP